MQQHKKITKKVKMCYFPLLLSLYLLSYHEIDCSSGNIDCKSKNENETGKKTKKYCSNRSKHIVLREYQRSKSSYIVLFIFNTKPHKI